MSLERATGGTAAASTTPGPSIVDDIGAGTLKVVDSLVSAVTTRVIGTPVKVRLGLSLKGVLRGRFDRVSVETGDVRVGQLALERIAVRADDVALVPALPPRVETGPITFGATVGQDAVDSWTKSVALPLRIRFRPGAIVTRTGLAGLKMGEMEVDLAVEGRLLRLLPRRISVLGVELTTPSVFRTALPLPPLPRGFRLSEIAPHERRLDLSGTVAGIREPITLDNLRRVTAAIPGAPTLPGGGGSRPSQPSRRRRPARAERVIDVSSGSNGSRRPRPDPQLPRRTAPPTWE